MSLTPRSIGLPSKFPSFRRGQGDLILDLASHPTRTSLLCAPTGAGKTVVNIGYGLFEGARVLYLVGTKQLQSQVLDDFEEIGMVDVRGHRNYPCASRTSTKYDKELCTYPRSECLHNQAIEAALNAPLVVSNYAKWVTLSRYSSDPDALGPFDLLICDEAHGVRDWMTSLLSLSFNEGEVTTYIDTKLPSPSDSAQTWCNWGKRAVTLAESAYREEKARSGDTSTPRLRRIHSLGRDLRELSLLDTHNTQWIVEKGRRAVVLSPKWPAEYVEEHLFRGIKRVVLSSATIVEGDARDLGIEDFSLAESSYATPSNRRPFYFLNQRPPIRVQKKMSKSDVMIWVRRMDRFIDQFLDYKGIIHSRSYDWTQKILDESEHSDIMISHGRGKLEKALEEFKLSSPPSILISPAIEEGVDFPHDEARWGVVVKVPFLYAHDPLTKARKEDDASYMNRCTARALLQMVGRPVRAEDDWAVMMIPDDHWRWFRQQTELFPGWFKASWRETARVPEVPKFAR